MQAFREAQVKRQEVGPTSCIDLSSSGHGKQRRLERDSKKRPIKRKRKKRPSKRLIKNELPLQKSMISEKLSRQIVEQKRRLTSGEKNITSHSVLIVDQSASMRKSDVTGHRTRFRAALFTIANEMIAQPLRNDQISFTNVITVISMQGDAQVIIDKESITWELYNRLVDLADNSYGFKGPKGHGNYLPALTKATEVLDSCSNNCAMLLFFLSDGGPSDPTTLFSGQRNSDKLAEDAILDKVDSLCFQRGTKLVFGTFGFAVDHVNSLGRRVFDLLRSMTSAATAAGSTAMFNQGADPDSIRRSLQTLITALNSTRSSLSSLNTHGCGGGAGQEPTRMKRTDLLEDLDKNSKAFEPNDYSFHYNGPGENLEYALSSREYNLLTCKRNKIRWTYEYRMQDPLAYGIAIKKGYFGKGAERSVFEMTEVTKTGEPVGQPLVAKVSNFDEASQKVFHERCGNTQYEAGRLAKKFNEALHEVRERCCQKDGFPEINFLDVGYYQWEENRYNIFSGVYSTKTIAILCERKLDHLKYKKYNDNKGGVINVNKPPVDDDNDEQDDALDAHTPGGIWGEVPQRSKKRSFESSLYSAPCIDGVDEHVQPITHEDKVYNRVINDDIPQAFSHWSWQYTKGARLICDLQGVLSEKLGFELTDPVLHSEESGEFGRTDRGRKGQDDFFKTHKCTPLCSLLKLRPYTPDCYTRECRGVARDEIILKSRRLSY